jgi:diaminopimelate decarboxylase
LRTEFVVDVTRPAAPWWLADALSTDERGLLCDGRPVADAARAHGTPLYLYSTATVRTRLAELKRALDATGVPRRAAYAMKANRHAAVLAAVRAEGDVGIDCCSPREVALGRASGFGPHEIGVTASWQSDRDLRAYADAGVHVNLDSLSALRRWAATPGAARNVGLRLDPGRAAGWGGSPRLSYGGGKFGLSGDAVADAVDLARTLGLVVDELHVHLGWGLPAADAGVLDDVCAGLAALAGTLPDVATINVGGGLGWRQKADDRPLDVGAWSSILARRLAPLGRRIACESGTYVAASAGVLVVEVNTVEERHGATWIGIDAGHNVNGYAANYGIPHELIHVGRPLDAPDRAYVVAGNINESIDVFSRAAPLPRVVEGDLLAFFPAGAYGASMASDHCLRGGVAEAAV